MIFSFEFFAMIIYLLFFLLFKNVYDAKKSDLTSYLNQVLLQVTKTYWSLVHDIGSTSRRKKIYLYITETLTTSLFILFCLFLFSFPFLIYYCYLTECYFTRVFPLAISYGPISLYTLLFFLMHLCYLIILDPWEQWKDWSLAFFMHSNGDPKVWVGTTFVFLSYPY
jgi:hypothetical protein